MDEPEIILNLWYVVDDLGAIYSLRSKCYVEVGDDEYKLNFLRSRATKDYLVAPPFPVPKAFHTALVGALRQELGVALLPALELLGGPQVLFEDVYREMERRLPAQTKLSIGRRPLVCITPLLCSDNDELVPQTSLPTRLGISADEA